MNSMIKNEQGLISELGDNEVFIFGSNLMGRHGGGAALQAHKWGAKNGVGVGRTSEKTYAIPTLDGDYKKLPLYVIEHYLNELDDYTRTHSGLTFLLTKCGEGIAGFTSEEMESIMPEFPSNVIRV